MNKKHQIVPKESYTGFSFLRPAMVLEDHFSTEKTHVSNHRDAYRGFYSEDSLLSGQIHSNGHTYHAYRGDLISGNEIMKTFKISRFRHCPEMFCAAEYLAMNKEANEDILNEKDILVLGFLNIKVSGELHYFFMHLHHGRVPVVESLPLDKIYTPKKGDKIKSLIYLK